MNSLDLDFSTWTASDVRELRGARTQTEIAELVGVSARWWRQWEADGVSASGWPAVLRIYVEEGRDVRPLNCSLDALERLASVLGSYSELARELGVDRRTITKWRYRIGYVPGVQGYGRLVRICFEDILL